MTSKTAALRDHGPGFAPEEMALRVGRIVEVTPEGHPMVEFPGAPNGHVVARIVATPQNVLPRDNWIDVHVLILLENGDPGRPIITGVIRETLETPPPASPPPRGDPSQALKVNGKTLLLEGEEEIVLRCGLGSITVRADGKITIKGTRLISRASETNKVRGASVLIN